jgi:hypothetical protein
MKLDIEVPSGGDSHLNTTETLQETMAGDAQFWNQEAANLEVMAGILHALPSFNVHATPFGCGIEVAWGKLVPVMACILPKCHMRLI